jgi:hypothetical protein
LKRTFLALSGLVLLGAYVTACGYSAPTTTTSTTPTNPNPSHLTKRAFISNSVAGDLNVIDASLDHFSTTLIAITSTPEQMVVTPDLSLTLVFNASGPQINVVSNKNEASLGGILLPDVSTSLVAMNSTAGFASVRNAQALEVLDLANVKLTGAVTIPTPNQIVLSHDGKKLLVFSDTLPDTVTVVDTTIALTATPTLSPPGAATPVASPNFDHPISAVFSTDDTKAYILNCGVECGGTTTSVTVLDMTTSPPTPGASVPVPGATVGLLNSSSLYVAGNSSSVAGTGVITVVNTGTLTAGAPVAIGDGFHRKMALDNHGHLFIGAKSCTKLRCLTLFNTANSTATVEVNPDPNQNGNGFGDVGGMQLITGRDRMYLAQGGELRIFDTTTPAALPTSQQLDAVGFIQDVVQVDP